MGYRGPIRVQVYRRPIGVQLPDERVSVGQSEVSYLMKELSLTHDGTEHRSGEERVLLVRVEREM